MRRAAHWLALACLLAAAPLGADGSRREPEPGRRREPAVSCAVVEIASDTRPRERERHGFRATRILGLEFETELGGRLERERPRTLRLRLYTPQGFLYQVLEAELDHTGRGRRRVEARLPVAGTSIMASGLYGRWRVVPYLDDAREPCGAERRFVLRP